MNVKIGLIFNSQAALSELQAMPLPFKASYAVARVIRKAADEVKLFGEKHVELVKKYGAPVEGSEQFKVLDENMPEFTKEYEELCNTEIVIADIDPIDVSLFGDVKVTPTTLIQLDWLLK